MVTIDSGNQPGWGASRDSSGSSSDSTNKMPQNQPGVNIQVGGGGTYTDDQGRPITREQAILAGRIDNPKVNQFERIQGLSPGSGPTPPPQQGPAPELQPRTIAPTTPPPLMGPRPGEYGYHATPSNPAGMYSELTPTSELSKLGKLSPQPGSIAEQAAINSRTKGFVTLKGANYLMGLSESGQKEFESLIGYNEESSPPVKALSGAAHLLTDIPGSVGMAAIGYEGLARQPVKTLTNVPSSLSSIGTGMLEQATTKPAETAGQVIGMIAISKIGSVKSPVKNLEIIKTPTGQEPWIVEVPNKLGTVSAPQTEGLILKSSNIPKVETRELFISPEKPGSLFVKIPRSEIEAAGTAPTIGGASGDSLAVRISRKLGLPYTIGSKAPALESVRVTSIEPAPTNAPQLKAINYDVDVSPIKPKTGSVEYDIFGGNVKGTGMYPKDDLVTGVPTRPQLTSRQVTDFDVQLSLFRKAKVNVETTTPKASYPAPETVDLSESVRTSLDPKYAGAYLASKQYATTNSQINEVVPPHSPVKVRTDMGKRGAEELTRNIAVKMESDRVLKVAPQVPTIDKDIVLPGLDTLNTPSITAKGTQILSGSEPVINVEYFNQAKDQSGMRFDKNFGSENLFGMDVIGVNLKKTQQPADTSILAKYFGTNPADVPIFNYHGVTGLQPDNFTDFFQEYKPKPTVTAKPAIDPFTNPQPLPKPDTFNQLDIFVQPKFKFDVPKVDGIKIKTKIPAKFPEERKKKKDKKTSQTKYVRSFRASPIAAASFNLGGVRKAMGLTTKINKRRKHK